MGGRRHVKKKKPPKRGPSAPAAAAATVVPPLAAPAAAPSPATIPARPLFVFDRERTSHPWADVLEPGGDSDASRLAIRENWRMDGRVDAGREAALLASPAFPDVPLSYADWQRQIETYFGQHSWNLGDSSNGRNRLRRGLSPAEGLLHVVSFARLVRYLQKRPGSTFEIDWTAAFPAIASPLPDRRSPDAEYFDQGWVLAEELNRHGLPEVQRAAGFLAD